MKADYGDSLRILLTVCCMVLLIACANIANLLLARGAARRSQTSVRLALGASRKRLIRQSFTESVVLSVLGGVAGIAVAYLGVKLIVALAFHNAHYVPIDASPSLPVLAFAFALSLVHRSVLWYGAGLVHSHGNPVEALRGANRSTRDSATLPQKILVVVQATLSIILLAGAGLLTRSLRNLEHQSFGFETDHRISIIMNGPPATYTEPQLDALYRELQDRLALSPELNARHSLSIRPTLTTGEKLIVPEGHGVPQLDENSGIFAGIASAPATWKQWASRFVRGRSITEDDTASTRNIAVVSEAFAKHFFPDQDPIGKHFGLDMPQYNTTFEIVGVVHDAKYQRSRRPPRADVLRSAGSARHL